MMKAYKLMIKQKLPKEMMKGISKESVNKIKKDIQNFQKSYVTSNKFKSGNDLKIQQLVKKISKVQNFEVISDYTTLKTNVLKQIDCGYMEQDSNYKIKEKNFGEVCKLL